MSEMTSDGLGWNRFIPDSLVVAVVFPCGSWMKPLSAAGRRRSDAGQPLSEVFRTHARQHSPPRETRRNPLPSRPITQTLEFVPMRDTKASCFPFGDQVSSKGVKQPEPAHVRIVAVFPAS